MDKNESIKSNLATMIGGFMLLQIISKHQYENLFVNKETVKKAGPFQQPQEIACESCFSPRKKQLLTERVYKADS